MAGLASLAGDARIALLALFVLTQILYLGSMLVTAFFYSRPVDLVKPANFASDPATYPPVLLFYPVLRELEETMRTTFLALDAIDYPRHRYRIVAIPNYDDHETIAALYRLQASFSWLEILRGPPDLPSFLERGMDAVGQQPQGVLVAQGRAGGGAGPAAEENQAAHLCVLQPVSRCRGRHSDQLYRR